MLEFFNVLWVDGVYDQGFDGVVNFFLGIPVQDLFILLAGVTEAIVIGSVSVDAGVDSCRFDTLCCDGGCDACDGDELGVADKEW